MAKIGRNDPCPCASARKAKHCCYSADRLASEARARSAFRDLCQQAAEDLTDVDREELAELFHEALHLPETDLSLQIRLPTIFSLEIERARAAADDDDDDAFDEAVIEVARQLNTTERRLELARAIVAMRGAGGVEPGVAAAAVFDLSEVGSAVFVSSVAESIAVSAGDARTPAGLLVAVA